MVALQRELAKTNTGIGTDAMAVTIPSTRAEPMLLSNVDGNATIGTGTCEFHYYDTKGYDYRQLAPHVARLTGVRVESNDGEATRHER